MPGMRFAVYKFEKDNAVSCGEKPNSQIQKNFNGLQFRNHHAILLRAGILVSLNGYIFVNSIRFLTVSQKAECVTLRQPITKVYSRSKTSILYRQGFQFAEKIFLPEQLLFLLAANFRELAPLSKWKCLAGV
jgi:hypothetical protein